MQTLPTLHSSLTLQTQAVNGRVNKTTKSDRGILMSGTRKEIFNFHTVPSGETVHKHTCTCTIYNQRV